MEWSQDKNPECDKVEPNPLNDRAVTEGDDLFLDISIHKRIIKQIQKCLASGI
jgi:hypothetical protein